MIKLQRASAGSGKTYTLAKKYIWYLITVPAGEERRRRLRTPAEIADSARHILAVTFTNKATKEMKERIVERLADLSGRIADRDKTPYLKEFMEEAAASEQSVRHTCALALKALLDGYSDFQVSTIDSFFQSILRTFAYESELHDSYQVEIDSKLAAQVGIDATLSSVNGRKPDAGVRFWLKHLMDDTFSRGNRWNLFNKSARGGYSEITREAEKMEKEDFKRISPYLDEYFREHPDELRLGFEEIDGNYRALIDRWDKEIAQRAAEAEALIGRNEEQCAAAIKNFRYIPSRLAKGRNGEADEMKEKAQGWISDNYFKKNCTLPAGETGAINDALTAFYRAITDKWSDIDAKGFGKWEAQRKTLPMLGLFQSIRENSADFFRDNNTVPLGETNSMLERIIGDDDAPFIYERLGTRLESFLIDEFQDTSAMQWGNFRPLIHESEARGGENLIIGDAKQSIYRFRNADPSLIMTRVPEEFDLPQPSYTYSTPEEEEALRAENTNYRSHRRIVEFNNTLFRALAQKIDEEAEPTPDIVRHKASPVYSNVVQWIKEKRREGYVHIELTDDSYWKAELTDEEREPTENAYPPILRRIPEIINDIRRRGYTDLSRISILVGSNNFGRQTISALMDYNRNLGEGERPIDFVSEESLTIANSESVHTIVAVLRMIAADSCTIAAQEEPGKGKESADTSASDPEAERRRKREERARKYRNIGFRFNYYATTHPDLSPTRLLEKLEGGDDEGQELAELIDSSLTTALPALVESIILRFVRPEMRDREAPFLAAFQDLVADHCERYAADTASFLRWWDTQGCRKSISSPEGMDAVSVMTIHKAKGLEADFVILPEELLRAPRINNEWAWVPGEYPECSHTMPPVMPATLSNLKEGKFAQLYYEAYDAELLDNLNTAYVALTRARKELWILAPVKPKKDKIPESGCFGHMLNAIVPQMQLCLEPGKNLLPGDAIKITDSPEGMPALRLFEIGKAITAGEEPATLAASPSVEEPMGAGWESKPPRLCDIDSYRVSDHCDLKYRMEPLRSDEEDPDPRSMGNLFHRAMERIDTAADVGKSLLALETSGEMEQTDSRSLRALLERELAKPEVASWFAPGLTVLSERTILSPRKRNERPDRVIVRPDGSAVVIDYKFGDERRPSHIKQVESYCDLLRSTSLYKCVEGRIWYVRLGEIVNV